MKVIEIIAKNIKAKREELNWSQEPACEDCTLSIKAYGELERGRSNTRLSTLRKVRKGMSGIGYIHGGRRKRKEAGRGG